jgi:DNA-directed RNA polymerase subunit RPC12/RpoP
VRYAVIACSLCRQPWAIEQRNQTAKCPACSRVVAIAGRLKLWEGDNGLQAAEAAGRQRASGFDVAALENQGAKVPRHDSPADAAAAQAQGIINQSRRAESVATWMTRLVGQPSHQQLVEAMAKAGLEQQRAEREIVRMLACDYLTEPRAGTYRVLAS